MNARMPSAPITGLATSLAKKLVFDRLSRIRSGKLVIEDAEGTYVFGDDAHTSLRATISIRESWVYLAIATSGALGAGEAFMEGAWDADDLVAVVRIMARAAVQYSAVDTKLGVLRKPVDGFLHALRRNTVSGSRKNIREHYDLGNEFFAQMLDPTMMYSAGIFERPGATMEEASVAKLDRICKKLGLVPSDHVLEIGTGWGGFALHAASRYGCKVTTTTISKEQHDLAVRRVKEAGLEGRVTVLLEDYRNLSGTYSKLVSIEMIEAVGDEFLPTYFGVAKKLLARDGLALIQAITVPDAEYDAAVKSVDFVKRYIFPGCQIPSMARMAEAWAETTDFRLVSLEDLTPHYAWTLRAWRERFLENRAKVAAMGYPERFLRMWEFYLAYCEGGFAERRIGDVQILLARPENRDLPLLPPLNDAPAIPAE